MDLPIHCAAFPGLSHLNTRALHTKSYVPIALCIYIYLFKINLSALVKSKFSHLEVVIFSAVENSPSFAVLCGRKRHMLEINYG
jgi:hypothetical protein